MYLKGHKLKHRRRAVISIRKAVPVGTQRGTHSKRCYHNALLSPPIHCILLLLFFTKRHLYAQKKPRKGSNLNNVKINLNFVPRIKLNALDWATRVLCWQFIFYVSLFSLWCSGQRRPHEKWSAAVYRMLLADFNPLNAELNPNCYLLALLTHHFLHVSRIRVKSLTLRLLMSYIIWSAYSWCF